MKLYKNILPLILLSSVMHAATLKEIIQSTLANNDNIKTSILESKAQQKSFHSVGNIYNPTANIGINYSRLDLDTRTSQVKSTTTGFLKLAVNLYDGGKNKAIKKQKNYEYKSSLLNTETISKETILQVITLFFQIKTIEANINVFKEKADTLKAQYLRIQTKYDIKMVTIDEVLKLQSEYESNQYIIEDLKYQKITLLENINLLSNKNIQTLDNSTLPEISNFDFQKSTHIHSLEMSINAMDENINIVSSINKPQFKLENNLNQYKYDDYNEKILQDLPDRQNQFIVSLSYNLFDSTSKSKIESTKIRKLALKQKVNFIKKQEKMNFLLAKRKLITQELKINSLKSAVEMGKSVYDMVKIKYYNGIVDNITYLDALSKNTYNKALYKQALYNYEIAKANYYFTSGVDYKTMLKMIF